METIRIAAAALTTHKLRSFLTLLGVIIGVMTVVSVVSIISGLNHLILEKILTLNPDVFIVTRFGIITSQEAFLEAVKRKPISMTDFREVQRRCTTCEMIGGSQRTGVQVKRGAQQLNNVQVLGATANIAEITNVDVEEGRFFTQSEAHHSALVAVIGSDVRDELFGKLDPVGRQMSIAGQPVRVIGLLRKQGAAFGESQDKQIYIPLSLYQKRFGSRRNVSLFIRAKGGIPGLQKSVDEVRTIIRARRRTAFRADDPFGIVTAEAVQIVWRNISAGAFALMVFISGISLVVGGIVIMNIMLVSVVERTREIGIRRAIGATSRNIQRPFLTEAVLLALVGGAIGVLLGFAISKAISTFSPLPTLIRPALVLAALGIAAVTGVVAGFLPAKRAAGLPPIEALRWE
ncbi:MAG TPA: ABC transporter permease [Thermoanaerobaculia bacterium]|nr:ABC transporter permease [Thermoanaerobaculia bacterium]